MTIPSSAIENGPDPGFIVSAKPSFWVTAINVFALSIVITKIRFSSKTLLKMLINYWDILNENSKQI